MKYYDVSYNNLTDVVLINFPELVDVNIEYNRVVNMKFIDLPNLINNKDQCNPLTNVVIENSENIGSQEFISNRIETFKFKKLPRVYYLYIANNPLK